VACAPLRPQPLAFQKQRVGNVASLRIASTRAGGSPSLHTYTHCAIVALTTSGIGVAASLSASDRGARHGVSLSTASPATPSTRPSVLTPRNEILQTIGLDARQRVQIGPLVLVRLEPLIQEQRVALLAGPVLQRQCDQVPKPPLGSVS